MSQSVAQLPSFSIDGPHTVVKVFLVNGESRSLRLDERTDVNVSPFLPLLLLLISITQGEVGGADQSYTQAHMMALVYTTPVLLQMNALQYVDRGGVHVLYRAIGLQVGAVVVKAGHDEIM